MRSAFVWVLVASACGPRPGEELPPDAGQLTPPRADAGAGDAGLRDGGGATDAGAADDAGSTVDGGGPTDGGTVGDGGAVDSSFESVAVEPTNDHLDDWGNGAMMSPALAASGTLRIRYCAAHFPLGSTALTNLVTAVDAYNALPGVSFHLVVEPEPGTETHPDLATFVRPNDAIYFDYKDSADGGWAAATGLEQASCTAQPAPSPKACSRGHIWLASDFYAAAEADPMTFELAPAVGVYMHELGHAFGEAHLAHPGLRDVQSMTFDRVTQHGPKFHRNDPRGTSVPAATLVFLRRWYGDASPGLDTEELAVHPIVSRIDAAAATNLEVSLDKTFTYGDAVNAFDGLNETKLRWSSSAGGFVTCRDGAKPRWFVRYSDLSTNPVDKTFSIAFDVSTTATPTSGQWSRLATRSGIHTNPAGVDQAIRQGAWERELSISAGQVGLAPAGPSVPISRTLAFIIDSSNALIERDESNNRWQLKLCLYPEREPTSSAPNDCSEPLGCD